MVTMDEILNGYNCVTYLVGLQTLVRYAQGTLYPMSQNGSTSHGTVQYGTLESRSRVLLCLRLKTDTVCALVCIHHRPMLLTIVDSSLWRFEVQRDQLYLLVLKC